MIGLLSFLAVICVVAFIAAVVLLMVRSLKRQPRKPFAILAVVSAVAFCGLSVMISNIYVPAEKPQDAVSESKPTSAPEAEKPTKSSDTSVDNAVDKTANAPSESSTDEVLDHSDAPEEHSPAETDPPSSVDSPATSDAPAPESSAEPAETEPSSAPAKKSEKKEKKKKSKKKPAPAKSLAETYKTDVVVDSKTILDRFITNYTVSLAPQLWTVADFDSNGAVIALADVEFKSSGSVERALVVLTPIIENEKVKGATPHYVAVGDTVYGDDGYCDDVFSDLQEAMDTFDGGDSE